jgi:DnaJ-class molecular chaperone
MQEQDLSMYDTENFNKLGVTPKEEDCPYCGGTGLVENYSGTDCDVKICSHCLGTGLKEI